MLRKNFIAFAHGDNEYRVYYKKYQNGKGRDWRLARIDVVKRILIVVKLNFALATELKLTVMTRGLDESASLADSLIKTRRLITDYRIQSHEKLTEYL